MVCVHAITSACDVISLNACVFWALLWNTYSVLILWGILPKMVGVLVNLFFYSRGNVKSCTQSVLAQRFGNVVVALAHVVTIREYLGASQTSILASKKFELA